MPGPVFIEGDRVTLRPIEEEDLPFVQRNANDPAVWHSLAAYRPMNARQEREWLERTSDADDRLSLLVCDGDDPAGSIGLDSINEVWGTAEVGFWIPPDHQDRGLATEATALLAEYAFDHRRLHKLSAQAYDFNRASQRVLEKTGFTEEGVLRKEAFVDGAYRDVHHYGLLADEHCDGG